MTQRTNRQRFSGVKPLTGHGQVRRAGPPRRPVHARVRTLRSPLDWIPMAKPNYSFEKRQRELAKKKKQDEKDAKKRAEREAAKPDPENTPPHA